jgi:hypothetical protein
MNLKNLRNLILVFGVVLSAPISSVLIMRLSAQVNAAYSSPFEQYSPRISQQFSNTNAKYQSLERFLKAQKWQHADAETTKLMLEIAYPGQEVPEVYIDPETMAKFPCSDLKNINQLWSENSESRLSFSLQNQLFQEMGDWVAFTEEIGWSPVDEVNDSTPLSEIRSGNLPSITREIGWPSLADRLSDCGI